MANRFWVGGTGTWDASTTTHWAASSNGSGGQSVPGSSDAVIFDASSGGGTVTVNTNVNVTSITMGAFTGTLDFSANNNTVTLATFSGSGTGARTLNMGSGTWTLTGSGTTIWNCTTVTSFTFTRGNAIVCNYALGVGTRTMAAGSLAEANAPSFNITAGTDTVALSGSILNLDFTGFAGTFGNNVRTVYGSLTLTSGMALTAGTNLTTFAATSGTKIITSNTNTMDFPVTFNGAGGTWQLADKMTVGAGRIVTLTAGTLDAGNKDVSVGQFSSTGSTARAILMGTGTWHLTTTGAVSAWNVTSTGMTLTPSSSTISIEGSTASARTFAGGGLTYWNLVVTNATSGGQVSFTGSNTFNDLKQQDATQQTLMFLFGTTTTVTTFSAFGTAGNLLTLTSSTTSQFTLTKAGGGSITGTDYLSISYSAATPGGTWFAGLHSTNGGNNSGWIFFPMGFNDGVGHGGGMGGVKSGILSGGGM